MGWRKGARESKKTRRSPPRNHHRQKLRNEPEKTSRSGSSAKGFVTMRQRQQASKGLACPVAGQHRGMQRCGAASLTTGDRKLRASPNGDRHATVQQACGAIQAQRAHEIFPHPLPTEFAAANHQRIRSHQAVKAAIADAAKQKPAGDANRS